MYTLTHKYKLTVDRESDSQSWMTEPYIAHWTTPSFSKVIQGSQRLGV